MIEIVATAESVEQGKRLIEVGVDTLYIGNDTFGLRLPYSFTKEETTEMIEYAHANGKKVYVAVNALMHNDRIEKVVPYLTFLQSIGVDAITVGDPGVVHLLKKENMQLPFIYDAQTMVTSAKQVNFWAKRGAVGAVLARELPYEELCALSLETIVPTEMLVYGATCIHQSKRPLVHNYFSFVEEDNPLHAERPLFLSEPKKDDTKYSIYEDINGTHIFATDDINLLPQLDKLVEADLNRWKLDGLFNNGERFVAIAAIFVKAKKAFEENKWTDALRDTLNEQLLRNHPSNRSVDEGFFLKNPLDVQ